ncbi:MAG: hypothetical protein IKB56_07100, partial [Clostridia bacterium]|nr:hypothetical protein [Clostridia bacterium]
GYPANMVDEEGFIKAWYCVRPGFLSQEEFSLRERCKRLVIFAPVGTIYERLSTILNRSVYKPVGKNLGLSDIGIKELFKLLKKSPSAIS